MSQRDDIEFDFFEEPATQETAPRRRGGDGPSGRPPRRPPIRPPANIGSLSRLVGLVAAAIFVVVLLVFWIQGCRSDSKRDAYRDYMTDIGQIAEDSEQVGRQLNTLLTTPGIRQQQLQNRLDQLAQQQLQGATRARELSPPGPIRDEHLQAVIALEERTVGLRRLQDAFQQTASAQNADREEAGELLATQMRRFVASDVMWEDLFRVPSVATLRQEGIAGVEVPQSVFLTTPDLATARAMTPVLDRIRGASTGGTPTGLHGNSLVQTRALPSGQVLRTDEDNTIVATADLAFEATVENSGDSQEVRVKVTLRVEQSPRPIEKTATIDIIDAGERKTVVFRNLGQIVQFAQKTNVVVQVAAVPGEQRTQNNSATYPVIFTLTPP
jgi:hypothetical protein